MKKNKIKKLEKAGWKVGNYNDFLEGAIMNSIEEKLKQLENNMLKQQIKIARLSGEWQGMLETICMWDIPQELKEKLQKKIKELK